MTAAALLLFGAALTTWPRRSAAHRVALLMPSPRRIVLPRLGKRTCHVLLALTSGLSVFFLLGGLAGTFWGTVVATGAWWLLRRSERRRPPGEDIAERLRVAGTLDLFAACLKAGLPVPIALEAVADIAPEDAGRALRSASGLLALGATPDEAWAPVRSRPELSDLATAAIRTSRAGTALAAASADLAARLRADLDAEAEERAEHASVVLALPVGLCFLPAFFCLGVLPVVIGLAGRLGSVL